MASSTSRTDRGAPTGRGFRVSTRIEPLDGGPALEVVETAPDGPRVGAPLLLVHGAFGGAWVWSETLAPYLARRGRHVIAASLRGHGRSEGAERLRETSLDDYLDDVRRVMRRLPQTPVVVGHSLGGLVAQRLVGRAHLRGLVLLASLPPEGLALVNARTAMTEPVMWLDAFLGAAAPEASAAASTLANARRLLFSDALPRERVRRYAAQMVPESPLALRQAHMPGAILSAFLTRIPTLVIGGAQDRLVWRSCTLRTAFYHAGRHCTVEECGHFPMLDAGAETAARRIVDWLEAEGL